MSGLIVLSMRTPLRVFLPTRDRDAFQGATTRQVWGTTFLIVITD